MKQLFKLLIEASKEDNKIILTAEADIDELNKYIMPLVKAATAAVSNLPTKIPTPDEPSEPEQKEQT